MAMTKKDFIELAKQIKYELQTYKPGSSDRKVAVDMVKTVATGCRQCNINFQYDTFYAACGVTDEDLS
jgi:hypothetical protein